MIKRREVLKGLTIAAGGLLLPKSAWSIFATDQGSGAAPPLAVPVRGLVKKDGKLMQPIQISFQNCGKDVTAVTTLDGVEIDKRDLTPGANTFQVFATPVNVPQDRKIELVIGGSTTSAVVKLHPVRKVVIYILPHSHHDLGYTDIQANIEEKQMHNISLGIDLARRTAGYPEGARFVWNLEVLWGADMYMRRKSRAEKDELIDAIRQGWVSINGMYANELTGLCRPEELLQLFRYGTKLGKQCGVKVDSAMLSDVPGYTWGTVTAMSQAGIRYFSAAPNNSDRIGRIKLVWHDKPFWHVSPSGKEKVLVWVPARGYTSWSSTNSDMVAGCQEYLDSVNFPYDISYIRWSGHGDNALPDPQICEFVKTWGETYEWPKFAISSTSGAFSAFDKRYGSILPQFKGDLTPYWEDGAGSSALETRMNRNSANRLTEAATLAAMLSRDGYQSEEFGEAWTNVLLYSEHTWGASASIRNPDSSMVTKQWAGKRQFALNGDKQSRELLKTSCLSRAGKDASVIEVLNATSWPRTEVVLLSKELSSAGDRVKDDHGQPLVSQRLSTGELAVLVRDVPAFGSAHCHLSTEKPHELSVPVAVKDDLLDNGVIRVRVDAATGNLIELTLHGKPANLIDTTCGKAANEYLFVEGKKFAEVWNVQNEAEALHYGSFAFNGSDVGSIQRSGPVQITVEEKGPLVGSLRIESSAPGCYSLVRHVRLSAGADWVELSNLVDKKPSPSNPHPEDIVASRAWAQYGGKESVQFAFPFAIPDGKMHMDIPLAEMQPEIDQLPGSNKNWLPMGRWIDVANEKQGVTWVTLDAPLVEVGEISATLAGAQHNPLLWRDYIAPTQKFYSWVMNNLWDTNYRASQEGPVEFRYALRAHDGYNPAAASRLAIGLSQPLITRVASADSSSSSLLQIEPADVLASALKPSEDGKAWIVRLFGASGDARKARLRWSTAVPPRLWLSDLSERPISPLDEEITVAGWDLVTIRADRSE